MPCVIRNFVSRGVFFTQGGWVGSLMSCAHLIFILYSRLYLVRGLVITVRQLIVTDTNVCVTLSRQVFHSMTSSLFLKTSKRFTLFPLFQHSPSSWVRADTNLLLSCLIFLYSSRLAVRPFCKSSFCAISSLTFRISAIFLPFGIPMMLFLNSKNFPPPDWICHEVRHHFNGMAILQTDVFFFYSVLYE